MWATWTTREPRGFTDEQIAGIQAIMTPLARVAEVRALRRTASTLLDTYVGHDAGERILAGHRSTIRRATDFSQSALPSRLVCDVDDIDESAARISDIGAVDIFGRVDHLSQKRLNATEIGRVARAGNGEWPLLPVLRQ